MSDYYVCANCREYEDQWDKERETLNVRIEQLLAEVKFWKEHADSWEAFGMDAAAELQSLQKKEF